MASARFVSAHVKGSRSLRKGATVVVAFSLLIAGLVFVATPSPAAVAVRPNGRAVAGGAARAVAGGSVTNHGGPIEDLPDVFVVRWGWTSDPDGLGSYLSDFLSTVGESSWFDVVSQYGVSNGLQYGGTWADSATVPAHPSDAEIQAEAARAADHFGVGGGTSWNVQIVVATPTGHSSPGFGSSFCAYHKTVASRHVTYTNLPYMTDNAGCAGGPSDVSSGESHELAESATDPTANAWFNSTGNEIGDLCEGNKGFIDTSKGSFGVQALWSNAAGACALPTGLTSFNDLGGALASGTSAVSGLLGDRNRIDTFAIAGSGQDDVFQKTFVDGTWRSSVDLGQPSGVDLTGTPASVLWHSGSVLDVFARGNDNQLWQRQWNTSWGPWTALGGVIHSGVTAVSPQSNELDVFAVAGSTGDHLFQKRFNGSWGAWTDIGRPSATGLSPSPGAVTWAAGRIDVFATGVDAALWQRFFTPGIGWSAWRNLGGALQSGPSAVSVDDGRLDVFAIAGSTGDRLFQKTFDGSWEGWADMGRPAATGLNSQPGAVVWNGSIGVFPQGNDGSMWERWELAP